MALNETKKVSITPLKAGAIFNKLHEELGEDALQELLVNLYYEWDPHKGNRLFYTERRESIGGTKMKVTITEFLQRVLDDYDAPPTEGNREWRAALEPAVKIIRELCG
jgi:hypothetical protein